jgi:HD-GYP domain-containing protein (c-di-GMP phosphodiesterase class II)
VRWHHERPDGGGYPDGLRGFQIPLEASILAVADAYDAMITTRCYGTQLSPEEAVSELQRCAGTQFDPVVVAAVVRCG